MDGSIASNHQWVLSTGSAFPSMTSGILERTRVKTLRERNLRARSKQRTA